MFKESKKQNIFYSRRSVGLITDVPQSRATIHLVTDEELLQYEEYVMSKFDLRSYTFSNIALLKKKNKIDADIVTDQWPEFKCTVIKLPISKKLTMVFFLSNSHENLEKMLFEPKFSEKSLFFEFDDNTYDHFKGVMRSWPLGFSERIVSKYRSLYYPGSADDLPSLPCPKGTFNAKLKVGHASFISEIWDYLKHEHRLEYLKYLIEKCFSVGLFLEADPSQPISWAFLSNFGHINAVYTVEKHRRKGYSRVTMLHLMKQMLEANMIPVVGIDADNTPSMELCTGLGFVEAFDTTCISYS